MKNQTKPETTLRGILVPMDWDADGNVSRLALHTINEEEFEVLPPDDLSALKRLLRKEVVVRGVVKIRKAIQVSSVSIVE